MGIKGFQSFMKKNSNRVLRSVEISNQYVVIDGSELLYTLYCDDVHYHGRGNYIEFRDKLRQFFTNLQACNIKPIVVKDGFKFEYSSDMYTARRGEKIRKLIQASRKENHEYNFKGYFSETVFKQTAKEMGVPWIFARHNADEDIAAISQLLDVPVLANNTIFCAYRLQAGFLPLKDFDWKRVSEKKGNNFIKAKLYHIDNFAEKYDVTPDVLSFLAIVFDNKTFDKYQALRQEISSSMGRRYDRPYSIQTFLNWHAQNRCSNEVFIDKMIEVLPREIDRDEEEEQIQEQINGLDNPKLKRDFLSELLDTINDPECKELLSAALNDFRKEEEERKPVHRQDILQKVYAGDYPYWALQLLINHDWGNDLVHFLPLVISDPTRFPTPQKAGEYIREWSYRLLFRETDRMSIRVNDRESLNYESEIVSFETYRDDRDLFSAASSEETTMLRRRDFLLDVLIEDSEHSEYYKQQIDDLSDDMKLTMAVTIYWISKANPNSEMRKAMIILLTLMQLKARYPDVHSKIGVLVATLTRMSIEFRAPVDTQVLQWTSEWEVIMGEAVSLNQILMSPLPKPIMGRFFSGSILEDIFVILSRNENSLNMKLGQLDMFNNLEALTSTIIFQTA